MPLSPRHEETCKVRNFLVFLVHVIVAKENLSIDLTKYHL